MRRWTCSVGMLIMQTINKISIFFKSAQTYIFTVENKTEYDFDHICWTNSINNNSVILSLNSLFLIIS